MPCAVREVGLNYQVVPSGPEICAFRNQPKSMHMASNYWGAGGRYLA